jgi:hypothetical protein
MKYLFVAVLLLASGCGTNQQPTTPKAQSKPVCTHQWEGQMSPKTTEPFIINDSPWVVGYATGCTEGNVNGFFNVQVYKINSDGTTQPVKMVANNTEAGSDEVFVYDTGTFHLEIVAASMIYSVGVYEFKD